jgi:hypothetical protein
MLPPPSEKVKMDAKDEAAGFSEMLATAYTTKLIRNLEDQSIQASSKSNRMKQKGE